MTRQMGLSLDFGYSTPSFRRDYIEVMALFWPGIIEVEVAGIEPVPFNT